MTAVTAPATIHFETRSILMMTSVSQRFRPPLPRT
jgi:hypothetical protein